MCFSNRNNYSFPLTSGLVPHFFTVHQYFDLYTEFKIDVKDYLNENSNTASYLDIN